MDSDPKLKPEIGSDGIAREAPVIAYTEKIIEEEQLQLKKYIEENYSKIRDVERELENLTMEMKLTAGPKKAALELLRNKIEVSNEKIRTAKLKEEKARKAFEAASKEVIDEEAIKQKLCEDLNCLVQESSNAQYARLGELKRRLEALNPSRASTSVPQGGIPVVAAQSTSTVDGLSASGTTQSHSATTEHNHGKDQKALVVSEAKAKKKTQIQGRGRGIGAVPKGRGSAAPGWTGAGFDVDGRT